MTTCIEINQLKKTFGQQTAVNIDRMSIEQGEVYGLIGPNGAGKSTLMKMLCGLQTPSQGEILLNGSPINGKNRLNLLKGIGSLIESPAYYDNLSGYDNLKIIAALKDLPLTSVNQALAIVGLSKQQKKQVKHYSFGMKQRLGIAMAIMGKPNLIILDEPTNGLDPQAKDDVRHLIQELPKRFDTTIMVSSHALDDIERIASQIGIIAQGDLLYQGSVSHFKSRYANHLYLRTSDNTMAEAILQSQSIQQEKDLLKISYLNDHAVGDLIRQLNQADIEVYRVFEASKTLEELFIDFTKHKSL